MGNTSSSLRRKITLAMKLVKQKKTDVFVVMRGSLFPPEIIIEILSWLPLEFHGKLMLVCKQWSALIQDRHFIEKHMSRAQKNYGFYYLPTDPTDRGTLNIMLKDYEHVYACDGLYLQKHMFSNKYCLRNPTIKHVLELPDPHKGSHAMVFSYIPSTGNYKFVSVYDDESSTACCEVLSVETDEFSWRPLKMPTVNPNRPKKKFSVVSTGDAVHCVRVISSADVMIEEVVSLDLGTEQFSVTNIPSGQYKNWKKVWPLNINGKLALVDRLDADLCVLVLEDYKKQKWNERKPLIPSASMKALEEKHGTISPYSFDESELLRFWVKDRMFISYNVRTGKEKQSERLEKQGCKVLGVMHPLQHSLVRLKGMQPEEKTATQSLPPSAGVGP